MKALNRKHYAWERFSTYRPDDWSDNDIPEFKVTVPIDRNWDNSDNKTLVIMQSVAGEDLKSKALLTEKYGEEINQFIGRAFHHAKIQTASKGKAVREKDVAFAFINWQSFKTYHLGSGDKRSSAAPRFFNERILAFIKKYKPTNIIILGDKAASSLLKDSEIALKRGWSIDVTYGKATIPTVCTLDPQDLVPSHSVDDDEDDEGEDRDLYSKANLIDYLCRCMSTAFMRGLSGKGLAYSIEHVIPKYILIDTIAKFKKMMVKLKTANVYAVDTETDSLNRIDNTLYIIQFAISSKQAYILPFLHPESPFDDDEIVYIRKELVKFFCNDTNDYFSTTKYAVGVNLVFDIIQLKQQLKFPIWQFPIFDCQNGEYLFDENIGALDGFAGNNPKTFSMASMATKYGGEQFLNKSGFNKADRVNIADTSLEDESFLEYCALDVQIPLAIHEAQLQRAEDYGMDKYLKLCIGQQSTNSIVAGNMEHLGVFLDLKELDSLNNPATSKMIKLIDEEENNIHATKEVREANKLLNANKGVPAMSLFSNEMVTMNLFKLRKSEHLQILFGDVMELEAVGGYGKVKRPSGEPAMKINKPFQHYHRHNPIVARYTRIQKMKKLMSSYIDKFPRSVRSSEDGAIDGRLRPNYNFIYIVTGRAACRNPSLQQTPTRGPDAKVFKRVFITPENTLRLKTDLSANEVRFAANVAYDEAMAAPFISAWGLHKEKLENDKIIEVIKQVLAGESVDSMLLTEDDLNTVKGKSTKALKAALAKAEEKRDAIAVDLKQKGDIHIMNVKRFFNKWVDKKDPLRDAIKGVVFGVLYGKSAKTLARDIHAQKLSELQDAIVKMRKSIGSDDYDVDKLHELESTLEVEEGRFDEYVDLAKDIMAKMDKEWASLAKWIEQMHDDAMTRYYVEAPHGRRRNLFAIMFNRESINAAMKRRAVNSPIQGYSSDVNFTAARLTEIHLYKFLTTFGLLKKNSSTVPASIECAVHDSLFQTVRYELLIPAMQILQWCMSTGVTNWYAEYYGNTWLVPPELESDIGWSEDEMETWDLTSETLRKAIKAGLDAQFKGGYMTKIKPELAYKAATTLPQEWIEYLNEHYPWFDTPHHLEGVL